MIRLVMSKQMSRLRVMSKPISRFQMIRTDVSRLYLFPLLVIIHLWAKNCFESYYYLKLVLMLYLFILLYMARDHRTSVNIHVVLYTLLRLLSLTISDKARSLSMRIIAQEGFSGSSTHWFLYSYPSKPSMLSLVWDCLSVQKCNSLLCRLSDSISYQVDF